MRPPPWPIWAFLSVAILSLSVASSVASGVQEIAQYLLYFVLLYFLFADVFRGRVEHAWWAVVVGAAGAGLVALTQLPFVKAAVIAGSHGLIASDDIASEAPQYIHGLAQSAYIHSAYMAVLLPIVFAWICAAWPRRWAIAGAVGIVLAGATLVGAPHIWILLCALVWVAAALQPAHWWRPAALVCLPLLILQFVSPIHRQANFESFLNPLGDRERL